MFRYEFINAAYLIFVTFWAILNGGSYYIQIFSQRYNTKFPAQNGAQVNHQDNPDKSDWHQIRKPIPRIIEQEDHECIQRKPTNEANDVKVIEKSFERLAKPAKSPMENRKTSVTDLLFMSIALMVCLIWMSWLLGMCLWLDFTLSFMGNLRLLLTFQTNNTWLWFAYYKFESMQTNLSFISTVWRVHLWINGISKVGLNYLINSKQTHWSVFANGMHNALVVQRETEIVWFHLANNVTFTDHFFQTHILKMKIYIFTEKYSNSNLAYVETSGIHIFSMWFHVQQIVDHGTIPFHWSLLILIWIEFVVRIISSINSDWFNHTLAWRIKVFKHWWPNLGNWIWW